LLKVVPQKFQLDYEVVPFSDYESTVAALRNGEVDVIVVSRFFYFSGLCGEDLLPTGIIFRPSGPPACILLFLPVPIPPWWVCSTVTSQT